MSRSMRKIWSVLAVLMVLSLVLSSAAYAAPLAVQVTAQNNMVYNYDYTKLGTSQALANHFRNSFSWAFTNGNKIVIDDSSGVKVDFDSTFKYGGKYADTVQAVLSGKEPQGQPLQPTHNVVEENGQAVPKPVGQESLEVVSVSAINASKIKVTFSNGQTVEITDFTPSPLVPGENQVTFTYQGKEYTATVNFKSVYSLVITNKDDLLADSEAGKLLADGRTQMYVEATIYGPDGQVDTDFAGTAVFVSKLGLSSAQAECAFDKGKARFQVTLRNSNTDVTDEIKVRIKSTEVQDIVGLETDPIQLTYKAYNPTGGGGETTIRTYIVDSIKSADMADRVDIYIGGVANSDVDAVKEAIKNQVKIYNPRNQKIDIVDIANVVLLRRDSSVSASYVFTALLNLPAYNANGYTLDALQRQVMEDNAYNYYAIEPSAATVRLAEDTDVANNKFMLIDKFAPTAYGVKAFNNDASFLPANTLMAVFSEPVNRLTAENPENWVLNGHKLTANDVKEIRVLDIPTEEPLADDYSAVQKGKERNTVFITLTNTAVKLYLVDGQNLLQAKSIADWAGLTDLSDNNKITTQDFVFEYKKPEVQPGIGLTKESPEQFVITVNEPIYTDENATRKVDLSAAGQLNVQLLEQGGTVIENLRESDYRVVPLQDDQFILELTRDWTQILKDNGGNVAYHNKVFKVSLKGNLYDVYGNLVSSDSKALSASVTIPEDTESPDVKECIFADPVTGAATITMTEPVQLYDNVRGDFIAPARTPSVEQELGDGVPVPTFEYVKVSEGTVSAGTKVEGEIYGTPVDEHDVKFNVRPKMQLEAGDWKLVVRQISDDVGNTMKTREFPFTIKADQPPVPLGDNTVDPYIIWAYADDDKKGDGHDYIYILYSRQMEIRAIRAETYDINGKQVTQDANITSQPVVLYRQNNDPNNENYNNFYGDGKDAKGNSVSMDADMGVWRGQLVTIQLPADFIVAGDDIDGDKDGKGVGFKNVLTVPTTLKAIDDGNPATTEELLFDNNDGVNQFELKFDKGYGVNGIGLDGSKKGKVPAITNSKYQTVEAYISGAAPQPPVVEISSITDQTVEAGKTVDVTVTTTPADAVVIASSSDTSKATVAVNGNKLTVTGVAAGEVTITVTAKKDGYSDGTATFKVTVTAPVTAWPEQMEGEPVVNYAEIIDKTYATITIKPEYVDKVTAVTILGRAASKQQNAPNMWRAEVPNGTKKEDLVGKIEIKMQETPPPGTVNAIKEIRANVDFLGVTYVWVFLNDGVTATSVTANGQALQNKGDKWEGVLNGLKEGDSVKVVVTTSAGTDEKTVFVQKL
ncbi:Ig-like domain-containing protein [Desulfofundulus thermosubterraneus]|uniref:Ig-like domain (Group 2) n=1 Tax=Desulfofundulus thermosubterraneus DSM 16057 TaxID=1121432 RepID=A0A1M6GTU8_9FIRM|nr:Ig-like domain-containing protein [Desulfofundulus thermosubterraneus]SHJ13373.1 Ig-like domain (group 2) [Desulfofundulus thermosubterraneus DSM 16057]